LFSLVWCIVCSCVCCFLLCGVLFVVVPICLLACLPMCGVARLLKCASRTRTDCERQRSEGDNQKQSMRKLEQVLRQV
jgi:MFS superfamily sulfate permease-like transporter